MRVGHMLARWLGNWVLKTQLVFGSGSWRSSCWVSAVVLGGFLRNFCVVPAGFGAKNLVFLKKTWFFLKTWLFGTAQALGFGVVAAAPPFQRF